MRIAHVTCLYVPEHRGGAPQQCHQIAVGQHRIGHEVSVFTGVLSAEQPMLQVTTIQQDGLPVTRVITTDAFQDDDERNWRHPAVEPIFQRFLEKTRPDLVHFHSIQSLGASLVGLAKSSNARVVVTMHDLWWICERQFCIDLKLKPCIPAVAPGSCACLRGTAALSERRTYLMNMLEDVDLVLAPSTSLVDRLRMSGVARRIEVDPNGVPVSAAHARIDPDRSAASGRPLRALYVGGDAKQKGIHVLAEALRLLRGQGVTVETDVYGVDPLSLDVTSTLERSGARPHWAYEPSSLDAVMNAHDVVVLPSVMYESSSRAIREALVRGVAVVATEVGGPEEVIRDGINGLLVAPDDSAALANALRRLADDRKLLARLAITGPLGPVPTPEQQVAHLDELYRSMASAPARRIGRPSGLNTVLFVVGIDGSPLHYRVHQKVEQLAVHGVHSLVRRYTDPRLESDLEGAGAVIVYRAPATRELIDFIRETHRRQIPILFDVDDLIFDPEIAERLPTIAHLPRDKWELWIEGVRRYRATLEECGRGIGSTPEIAQQMERLGVPARVHPNGVDTPVAVVSERARRARGSRQRRPGDPFILGYSSGTTTHDADLAHVAEALTDFLRAYPEARLVLGGPLNPPSSLTARRDQIERLPFIGWERHPDRLSSFDLNLAPLIEGVFNESKSSIKWSEAALVDVPTLASASAPFRESIVHKETGLLAPDPTEWRGLLDYAIQDRDRLARIGRRARLAAYAKGSPWVLGENLLSVIADGVTGDRMPVTSRLTLDLPSEIQRSEPEPAGLLPGLRASTEEGGRAPSSPLGDHVLSFPMPSDAGPVSRVDVMMATFRKPVSAPVSLVLRGLSGDAVGRVDVAPDAIGDNGWAAFEYDPPIAEAVGSAELRALGRTQVAPYVGGGGRHWVDGHPRSGQIVARSFHTPPIPPLFCEHVPGFTPPSPDHPRATTAMASIAVRRAVYILQTDGARAGLSRIAGGAWRRLPLARRFRRR